MYLYDILRSQIIDCDLHEDGIGKRMKTKSIFVSIKCDENRTLMVMRRQRKSGFKDGQYFPYTTYIIGAHGGCHSYFSFVLPDITLYMYVYREKPHDFIIISHQ